MLTDQAITPTPLKLLCRVKTCSEMGGSRAACLKALLRLCMWRKEDASVQYEGAQRQVLGQERCGSCFDRAAAAPQTVRREQNRISFTLRPSMAVPVGSPMGAAQTPGRLVLHCTHATWHIGTLSCAVEKEVWWVHTQRMSGPAAGPPPLLPSLLPGCLPRPCM